MTSAIFSQQASSCQGLIYSILQNPQLSTGRYGFRAALVAAHPGAGTTHMTTILAESLNQDAAQSAVPLDGRELATLCGDPRTPAESAGRGGNAATAQSSPTVFNGSWSWRGSHDYRAAYLEHLQERFPYVLVDCPSLKESTEVLSLAPLVDGVLLVVEANRTQKSQVAYLEQTIEGAGGKVLGHLLNKRTYPIPAWLFNKLERWGI
ncbi:MAG: hypothetical protein QOH35_3771 [Acidobacteriaceae bacterium]|nr:hypothetical protein [Acidobacteriaceae bacterium]